MKKLLFLFIVFLFGGGFAAAQNANRLQLAERYAQSGQTDKALTVYEELYKADPSPFVYEKYLSCLQQLSNFQQAEKLIKKQMKSAPVAVLLKVDLAQNYFLAGQKDKGEAVLKEITDKTDFGRPGLSAEELAEKIVRKLKRYDAAIAVYTAARGQSAPSATPPVWGYNAPVSAAPYAMELANLYRLNRQYEPMLNEYLDVLKHGPDKKDEIYSHLQALMAGDDKNKTAKTLLQLIAKNVQLNPAEAVAQDLYIWALLQNKRYEAGLVQAKLYSERYKDKGAKWHQTLQLLQQNNCFELARDGYKTFIEQGEKEKDLLDKGLVRKAKIELLNLYFYQLESRKEKDSAEVERIKTAYKNLFDELGKVPESFVLYRNLAKIYAYYSHQKDSAQELLQKALSMPAFNSQQKAQIKIDLADMLLFYNKVWDATLLYSQVEKDHKQDAIGFYAKLQNARLSYYIGEFEWAQSQLHVLRAATSKLIANDAMELSLLIKEGMNPDSAYDGLERIAKADFLTLRNMYGEALELLDQVLEMPLEAELFDDVHLKKAQIYLKLDSVDVCLRELALVYTDNEDDLLVDDALFMAADLLGQRDGEEDKRLAMELYRRLFTDYKTSALAPLARERYRQLRGN